MGTNAFSGAASGAAAGTAALPGWGTAIGAGIGLAGGLLADNAAKKAAQARAAALETQAQRRLAQGRAQAAALKGQGQMDQTTYATRALSSGGNRFDISQDSSLAEIANRATNDSIVAMQNAEQDASSIRQDIGAINANAAANQTAGYFNAATSILGAYGSYNNATNSARLANAALEVKRQSDLANSLGTNTIVNRTPWG